MSNQDSHEFPAGGTIGLHVTDASLADAIGRTNPGTIDEILRGGDGLPGIEVTATSEEISRVLTAKATLNRDR